MSSISEILACRSSWKCISINILLSNKTGEENTDWNNYGNEKCNKSSQS